MTCRPEDVQLIQCRKTDSPRIHWYIVLWVEKQVQSKWFYDQRVIPYSFTSSGTRTEGPGQRDQADL